jgi:hypothetical protein
MYPVTWKPFAHTGPVRNQLPKQGCVLATLVLDNVIVPSKNRSSFSHRPKWFRLWSKHKLKIIFALALAIRFTVCGSVVEDRVEPSRHHWNFGYETGFVAASLANGHGFSNPLFAPTGPTAWLAPAYPLLLSGIFRVFGVFSLSSAIAILMFNSLCGALTCIPVYFIGKRVFGESAAVFAAAVWAVFPYSIYLDEFWIWDTALSALLLTVLLWLALELADRSRPLLWLAFGALAGLAALTNPVLLAPLPFLAFWILFRQRKFASRAIFGPATAVLAFALVVSPWLIRNNRVFQKPFLLKNNLWLEVTVGNLGSHRHWWNDDQHPSRNTGELHEMARVGEMAYMREKQSEAITFIRSQPGDFLKQSARRFVYVWTGFWDWRVAYLVDEPLDPINIVFCSTLTLLALTGLWRSWRRGLPGLFPCAAIPAALPLVHYVTHPFVSYRHPVDPVLVLFASVVAGPVLAAHWQVSTVRAALHAYALSRWPELVPATRRQQTSVGSFQPSSQSAD